MNPHDFNPPATAPQGPSEETLSSRSALSNPARAAALDWLMDRINYERTGVPYQSRQLKLDRMRQLLTRLGQPDAGMKIVHVAGTKGKGSTSAMIAAVLTAAGYRTGVFSSPHLEQIEERFAVDGQPCTSDELVALVNRMIPIARAMDEEAVAEGDPTGGPTYFEITTAMALVHFVEQAADAVVLEVGLGGRLDSTNVCLPIVSVITSISFDHMRQLGNTLASIAGEKAGIVKPGVPVVCGVAEVEPQAVIAQTARDHGCRLIQVGRDFTFEYRTKATVAEFDFRYMVAAQEFHLNSLILAMHGRHQAANAATALATISELRHQGWCISNDAIRSGLSRAALPGRVEVTMSDPTIVLDTAHNPASVRALVATLDELTQARRTLILSISHDKDVAAIVRELVSHFDRIVVTQYQENPRAVPVEELLNVVVKAASDLPVDIMMLPTPREAWSYAMGSVAPGECICIAGSFFLVAEMRPLIQAAVASEPLAK